MRVSHFIEKPSKQFAEDFLTVKDIGGNEKYYSVFGQYILTSKVFDALEKNINNGITNNTDGEFGLTEALASCINNDGLVAVVLQGEMFDIGDSKTYKNTVHNFSL